MNKKWNILIFSIIFVNIAVAIAYFVLSNSNQLNQEIDYINFNLKLSSNIKDKARNQINYNKIFNTDWSWSLNTRSCPKNITLSWTTWTWASVLTWVTTYSYLSWSQLICSGSTLSWSLIISYADGFTYFSWVTYVWSGGSLTYNWTATSWSLSFTWLNFYSLPLGDYFGTKVSFSWSAEYSWIDSNYNSDDYKTTSIWWVYYPDWYQDNDADARKTFYGLVTRNTWYYNIFWNNYLTNNYIAQNWNNLDNNNFLIWDTTIWKLKLEVDDNNEFNIKLIEFDSWSYFEHKELKKVNEWNSYGLIWSWYISLSSSWIYLTWNSSAWFIFDFKNKNYWLFLASSWASANSLKYKLSWKNQNWSSLYIVPINDSQTWLMQYLWTDIIINKWEYINKIMEVKMDWFARFLDYPSNTLSLLNFDKEIKN